MMSLQSNKNFLYDALLDEIYNLFFKAPLQQDEFQDLIAKINSVPSQKLPDELEWLKNKNNQEKCKLATQYPFNHPDVQKKDAISVHDVYILDRENFFNQENTNNLQKMANFFKNNIFLFDKKSYRAVFDLTNIKTISKKNIRSTLIYYQTSTTRSLDNDLNFQLLLKGLHFLVHKKPIKYEEIYYLAVLIKAMGGDPHNKEKLGFIQKVLPEIIWVQSASKLTYFQHVRSAPYHRPGVDAYQFSLHELYKLDEDVFFTEEIINDIKKIEGLFIENNWFFEENITGYIRFIANANPLQREFLCYSYFWENHFKIKHEEKNKSVLPPKEDIQNLLENFWSKKKEIKALQETMERIPAFQLDDIVEQMKSNESSYKISEKNFKALEECHHLENIEKIKKSGQITKEKLNHEMKTLKKQKMEMKKKITDYDQQKRLVNLFQEKINALELEQKKEVFFDNFKSIEDFDNVFLDVLMFLSDENQLHGLPIHPLRQVIINKEICMPRVISFFSSLSDFLEEINEEDMRYLHDALNFSFYEQHRDIGAALFEDFVLGWDSQDMPEDDDMEEIKTDCHTAADAQPPTPKKPKF